MIELRYASFFMQPADTAIPPAGVPAAAAGRCMVMRLYTYYFSDRNRMCLPLS